MHEYLNLLFRLSENVKVVENRHKSLCVCIYVCVYIYIYIVMNPALPALSSLNYKLNSGPNWLSSEGFMKCLYKVADFWKELNNKRRDTLAHSSCSNWEYFLWTMKVAMGLHFFFLEKNICSTREKRE